MNIIHFSSSHLPELSNFYALRTPLMFQGKPYATSEHLYQAMKYAYFEQSRTCRAGEDLIEEIRRQTTPYKAKILASGPSKTSAKYEWQRELHGRTLFYASRGISLDPRWDALKVKIMEDILRLKFFCNPDCMAILQATGNNPLVERTDTDSFWGDGKNRRGQNQLGQLLMKIRSEPILSCMPILSVEKINGE